MWEKNTEDLVFTETVVRLQEGDNSDLLSAVLFVSNFTNTQILDIQVVVRYIFFLNLNVTCLYLP